MQVVKLSQKHIHSIREFCHQCDLIGYKNNSSIELMKWGDKFDLPHIADFWALMDNHTIMSISGSHSFGTYDPNYPQLRCLFRSATLPKYANLIPGLSKFHMNSVPFSLLLPYQIAEGIKKNYHHFFLTTSYTDHDASGKMSRTHKAITLISKFNLVSFESNEIIYSTPQYKWRINLPKYLLALKQFEPLRSKLNIDEDYKDCIDILEKFINK